MTERTTQETPKPLKSKTFRTLEASQLAPIAHGNSLFWDFSEIRVLVGCQRSPRPIGAQAEAPDTMELHHLAVGSPDVEQLADFYRDVFSLAEIRRHSYPDGSLRSIWLDVHGTILMIEHTNADATTIEGIVPGPFLLAFRVAEENYDLFLTRLRDRDIEIEDQTGHTSYFRDPEGNRLAVSHYPRDGDSARSSSG
jgi:catechol 2,3-dioxygenase-like lactoylglutathione lyase family enzyme